MNKDVDFIESDQESKNWDDIESESESENNLDESLIVSELKQDLDPNQDLETLISTMTFEQAGKPWSKSDDEKLKDLYMNQKLDVIRIASIFKRGPNGIICRLSALKIIEEKKDAHGYSDYIKYKIKFKKPEPPRQKNQIDFMLEQSSQTKKISQQTQPIQHIQSSQPTQQIDLITELLELNENFDKKINAIKSEFNLGMMKIISKYTNINTTDPNTEIINIGLKKYILKNNKVYNIISGSLYGLYDSNSNKCVKL